MSSQYRLIVRPELRRQLVALGQAAKTQPGGLRDRELQAVMAGLRALADGREEDFSGRRLGFSPRHHDFRDCAEIKLHVVSESRGERELGPSHRLIYREFEADDGGLPYREAVSFEHRRDNRPFLVTAARLDRKVGVRIQEFAAIPDRRPTSGPAAQHGPAGPARQPLPPDLRQAFAAASGVAPAVGATASHTSRAQRTASRGSQRDHPTDRDR